MTEAAEAPGALATPGLRRRLACFLYEGVLLFGVVMLAGLVYGAVTNQRHALAGQTGLQVFLFVVLGVYFVTFWTKSGQTLAMVTWHIRVVTASGAPLTRLRAACRYVLAWLWFVPALLALKFAGLESGWAAAAALTVGVLGYAMLAWLHPDRQFWHDAACGTRLVTWTPARRRAGGDATHAP